MPIAFDEKRMSEVLDRHARWWSGTLDGPLMAVTIYGAHSGSGRAKAPALSQASCADFRWSPEELIETLDEELATQEFAGDAYPRVNFDAFGPGVLAALDRSFSVSFRSKRSTRITIPTTCGPAASRTSTAPGSNAGGMPSRWGCPTSAA